MSGGDVLVLLGMALAVSVPKLLPVVVLPATMPDGVRRWLTYIAPAVLSALVAPAILAPGGRLGLEWRLLGYGVAFVVAVLTRGMLRSLAAGLLVVIGISLLQQRV